MPICLFASAMTGSVSRMEMMGVWRGWGERRSRREESAWPASRARPRQKKQRKNKGVKHYNEKEIMPDAAVNILSSDLVVFILIVPVLLSLFCSWKTVLRFKTLHAGHVVWVSSLSPAAENPSLLLVSHAAHRPPAHTRPTCAPSPFYSARSRHEHATDAIAGACGRRHCLCICPLENILRSAHDHSTTSLCRGTDTTAPHTREILQCPSVCPSFSLSLVLLDTCESVMSFLRRQQASARSHQGRCARAR